MAITLPDARLLSDEVLEALRLRAIHGCELGFTEADVADLLGISRETVSRRWSAYARQGRDALPGDRTGRPVGSGRTLSDDQARHLQDRIDHNSPESLGIPSPLWLNETYPELAGRAGDEGADILRCDETGVAADEYPGYGYAREGRRATLEVPRPPLRVNMISAISNEGLLRSMTDRGNMNGALFLVFLGRLVRGSTRKVYPIADRLRAHDTEEVRRWVAAHEDRIELVPLPKSSPELNADEYLNNDMKGNVKAFGLPHDKEELRSLVQAFMRRLLHLPEHVMSYFLHPSVAYAAAQ